MVGRNVSNTTPLVRVSVFGVAAALLLAGIWIAKGTMGSGQRSAAPATPEQAMAAPASTPPGPTAVDIDGTPMYSSKNIVENLARSNQHTELSRALDATALSEMLSGQGPYTLFAPTNDAFAKLPTVVQAELFGPELKKLATVLRYHIVPGRFTHSELLRIVREKSGVLQLVTLAEQELTVIEPAPGQLAIGDARGSIARVQTPEAPQANGVLHVVDGVLFPSFRTTLRSAGAQ